MSAGDMPRRQQLRFCAIVAVALASAHPCRADKTDDFYRQRQIHESDFPANGPRWSQYPAPVYHGRYAPIQLKRSDMVFKTRLRAMAGDPPNFAGHYNLAVWGCGYACLIVRIIDVQTGRVVSTNPVDYVNFDHVASELLDASERWPGIGPVKFRADSRLLVLLGMPNENTKLHGISYYEMRDGRLQLLRRVYKAW